MVQTLLGRSPANIPKLDLFKGLPTNDIHRVIGDRTNVEQRDFILSLSRAPAGLAVCVGSPGTGKSYVIDLVVLLVITLIDRVERQKLGPMFIVSADNIPLDEFAIKATALKAREVKNEKIKVYRVHSKNTDIEVFNLRISKTQTVFECRQATRRSQPYESDLEREVRNGLSEATRTLFEGIDDERVRCIRNCMGYLIYIYVIRRSFPWW